MSVHFAPARGQASTPLARVLGQGRTYPAANDEPQATASQINATTQAALRLFAKHGLGAAAEARKTAELALQSGDEAEYSNWMQICRVLDMQEANRAAVTS